MRAVAAATLALALMAAPALAEDQIQVGRLSCEVAGGVGLIIGSIKDIKCGFHRDGHKTEYYSGQVNKFGLDIGFTKKTYIEWLVLAAASTKYQSRALAGTYVGASGEASVGVGVGANALIGGSKKGFILQPVSVQAQQGVNLALTLTGLTLR